MPRDLLWTPLANGFSTKDANTLLESLKASKITKSELVPCTVSTEAAPHNMSYRLWRCSCRACAEEAPYVKCPWRSKTLRCEKQDLVDILETGTHVTEMRAALKPRLTLPVSATQSCVSLTSPRKSFLHFRKIQRFCQHYASTKVGSNDYVKETRELIRDVAYVSTMDEHESFTFTLNTDADGLPAVGTDSDAKPFVVGVTSGRLLMRASRKPGSLLLHVDATFKLNQEAHYSEMFAALHRIYRQVVGKVLAVDKVMGDADDAQFNGVQQLFWIGVEVKYLMCFYHAVAKVFERTRGLRPSHAKLVMTGVYDMHFSLSVDEFIKTKEHVLSARADVDELAAFPTYFKAQWLTGRFTCWQVFHTPQGWAITNNPVEQYNRTLKRQYTLHSGLKMGALLGQFLTCCTAESLSGKSLATQPAIPKSLIRRAKEMSAAKLLYEYFPSQATIAFLLDDDENFDAPPDVVRVVLKPCPRIFDPEVGRTHEALMITAQQGMQLARMEVQGMPSTG